VNEQTWARVLPIGELINRPCGGFTLLEARAAAAAAAAGGWGDRRNVLGKMVVRGKRLDDPNTE
jgi:hypothetical protein